MHTRCSSLSVLIGLLLLGACGGPPVTDEGPAAQPAPSPVIQSVPVGTTITGADLASLPAGTILDLDLRIPGASYTVDLSQGGADLTRVSVTLDTGKSLELPAWLEQIGVAQSDTPNLRISAPGTAYPDSLCCKYCSCTPHGCVCSSCRIC